jgi:hypothetical protein
MQVAKIEKAPEFIPIEVRITFETREEWASFVELMTRTGSVPLVLANMGCISGSERAAMSEMMSGIYCNL